MNHTTKNRVDAARMRGAVMTEMVLVLPLVLLILALLLFLGRGHMRVQHAQVMDRYIAWHVAGDGRGPTHHDGVDGIEQPLNDTFFDGSASMIDVTGDARFPTDATDRLITNAGGYSDETGAFAQAAVDRLPRGINIKVQVAHGTNSALEERLSRTIRHRHTRMNTDWRAGNGVGEHGRFGWIGAGPGSHVNEATRDVFYFDIDEDLASMASSNNDVAQRIRQFYLSQPGYRGPYEDVLYGY